MQMIWYTVVSIILLYIAFNWDKFLNWISLVWKDTKKVLDMIAEAIADFRKPIMLMRLFLVIIGLFLLWKFCVLNGWFQP